MNFSLLILWLTCPLPSHPTLPRWHSLLYHCTHSYLQMTVMLMIFCIKLIFSRGQPLGWVVVNPFIQYSTFYLFLNWKYIQWFWLNFHANKLFKSNTLTVLHVASEHLRFRKKENGKFALFAIIEKLFRFFCIMYYMFPVKGFVFISSLFSQCINEKFIR